MGILRFWTIAFPTRRSKAMLKLFYITKDPAVARIAQAAGVDRIFVDMEYIGKAQRQGGMDTVQNHHTVEDVARLRPVLDQAELLVRVNPVHPGSKDEINRVIAAGADVIMLPMWQSVEEVQQFIRWVDSRAKTLLLLENQAAVDCLDRVVALPGVDEIHIGLNDLSISQGKKFLFQPLANGTVDAVCAKIKAAGIPFGFGGFGRLGGGTLPAAYIVAEHYRLGSSMSILSRAFCNTAQITDLKEIKRIFTSGVAELRQYEAQLSRAEDDFFALQHKKLQDCVEQIVEGM
jgi:2-keto-3-deoxy-L-rhamnonate aldolase RhmA